MLKSFLLHIHLILLRIASRFGVFLGKCIISMKKPRSVDLAKLKTFYLNRSDRIGDAIISKPFIKLLVEWLRANGCTAEIVILASKYNRFLLQDLEDTGNNVRVIEEQKNIDDYESKLSRMILKHIRFLLKTLSFRWSHGNDRDEQVLFLDMGGGDFNTILKYKELHNPIVAGPNIFWGSHILDIALPHSYVHYSNVNLIESYIEIITKIFAQDDSFQDFVYQHIGTFYDYSQDIERSGICLFVGVKEFRNLPIDTWKRVIREVSQAFPEETITVLDDHTNMLYERFLQESFPSNVILEKNTYSLQDFTKHISHFSFVVGIDGGGINMVKSLTNSCFINTFAQPNVWSGFTGDLERTVTKGQNNWYSTVSEIPLDKESGIPQKQEVRGRKIFSKGASCIGSDWEINVSNNEIRSFGEIPGQVIAHMHKTSFWLPTFNIDGNRELFRDFDTTLLMDIIRKALRK